MNYVFYVADTETTGLSVVDHDVIELSLYRFGADPDVAQKTWCFKPLNPSTIDPGALKVNKHKIEDLLHQTKEGRERYQDPVHALVEIENWLALDEMPATSRFLIGQNTGFDKDRLEQLWVKCNSKDSFPFGRRMIDIMVVELFFDYCKGQFADGYSLANFIKKYGVKNDRAHTAASDTLATKEVFEKQVKYFKSLLTNK